MAPSRWSRFLARFGINSKPDERTFERQVHAAARMAPYANVGHAGTFILVAVVVFPSSMEVVRLLWTSAGLGIMAATFVLWVPAARRPVLANPRQTLRQMYVVTLLFGVLWTIAAALCISALSGSQATIFAVSFAGVAGGGAMVLSTNRTLGIAWVWSIITGLVVIQLLGNTPERNLQALQAFLYAVVLCWGATYLATTFEARCVAEFSAESEQQKVELLLNEFERGSNDWIWETRPDGTMSHVSTRFAGATRLPIEQLQGWTLPYLIRRLSIDETPEGLAAFDTLVDHLDHERTFDGLVLPLVVDGRQRWWSLSGRLQAGSGSGWRGIGADITAVKEARDRIDHIATTDALSGLPNRYSFNLTLEALLAKAGDTGVVHLAILDLDNFKTVNDTLGHPIGDQLLVAVAQVLGAELVSTEVCARLGGDEFAIILSSDRVEHDAVTRIERLQSKVTNSTFNIQGNLLEVTSSIGYVSSTQVGLDAQALIIAADLALYSAKDSGRNRISCYTDELRHRAEARAQSLNMLAAALANHEFVLHYQPQVDLETNELTGFEALARWEHPTRGSLPPTEFIEVAEETGLIVPLGRETIALACRDARAWPEHLRLSVNVSPRELLSPGFSNRIATELRRADLNPERLVIEITESVLLDPVTFDTLRAIRTMGISVSVDDFGTGYSSLGQLQRTPVDELKIDRSFVSRMTSHDSVATSIVGTITSLAKALGLRTVAEGVEHEHQRAQLDALGCDIYQGYLESTPIPAEHIDDYIAHRAADVAHAR